ncbi:MAG: hypothetical protein D6679_07555 [Candidatus Hydrogenedentota bacterium]|nr:MAG: hypothetical protein D6679_07555 [Candidatus Hydrogenedentota bacterium]
MAPRNPLPVVSRVLSFRAPARNPLGAVSRGKGKGKSKAKNKGMGKGKEKGNGKRVLVAQAICLQGWGAGSPTCRADRHSWGIPRRASPSSE